MLGRMEGYKDWQKTNRRMCADTDRQANGQTAGQQYNLRPSNINWGVKKSRNIQYPLQSCWSRNVRREISEGQTHQIPSQFS